MIVNYKNVEIKIEDHSILENVNLEINENDFIFLTGKIGSGKTTLLRTLYRMIPVKGEEAQVLDFNMLSIKHKKYPELRKQLGIIFQDFQLLPDRTIYANLQFVLKATGWKKKDEINNRIEEVLAQVDLSDKADNFAHELSGGEQQRVAIARAILNNPKLIIADEPTGNLDEENSHKIVRILFDLSQNGAAVIMSTHNLHLLPLIKARVFNCHNHCLEEKTSTTQEVKEDCATEESAETLTENVEAAEIAEQQSETTPAEIQEETAQKQENDENNDNTISESIDNPTEDSALEKKEAE